MNSGLLGGWNNIKLAIYKNTFNVTTKDYLIIIRNRISNIACKSASSPWVVGLF